MMAHIQTHPPHSPPPPAPSQSFKSQELALLYRKLGTISTLHAEYARARPAPLHRTWFASFNPTQDTFPQWLPGFYKRVGEVWAEERRRCREVFGSEEAPAVLARLMVETFTYVFACVRVCLIRWMAR